MAPNEVLAFLDRYFGHMSQIVKGHDGIVNKFLGDGMLAFWGVHLVFEIQGRYFLGMYLLLPLWLAMMLRTERTR